MKKLGHPDMMDEARATSAGRSWYLELLIFAGVFIGVTTFESIPVTIGTFLWMFRDPGFIRGLSEALMHGDLNGYMEAVEVLMGAMPNWLMLVQLYSTVLMTAGTIFFCRVIEKRRLTSMGFRRGHILREYAVGALVGAAMIASALGLGAAFGIYRIEAAESFSVPMILAYFFGYVLQGMSEEVLCRGYLMVSIARKNPVWLAIVLNSAAFAALHLMNPGMNLLALFNIFLCGVVFSVYVVKRGNLWGACALHTFWNFIQGNIFGVSVSGTGVANGATPLLTLLNDESPLLTGGVFGVEGGLLDTFVELAALAVLLFLVKPVKEKQLVPYPAKAGTVPTPSGMPGGSPVIRIGGNPAETENRDPDGKE